MFACLHSVTLKMCQMLLFQCSHRCQERDLVVNMTTTAATVKLKMQMQHKLFMLLRYVIHSIVSMFNRCI